MLSAFAALCSLPSGLVFHLRFSNNMKKSIIPVYKVNDKTFLNYGQMLQHLIDSDFSVQHMSKKFEETIEGKRYMVYTLDVFKND
jgi:hypothetical protein